MVVTGEFSFQNASHFAKLSELAYEKAEDKVRSESRKFGYKSVKYFDKDGAQCYGFEHDNYLVLSFRGTEPTTANDVKADLNILHCEDLPRPGRVHRGFKSEVDTLWPDIDKWLKTKNKTKVYTCGHSLGGAMSGIAATRIEGSICYNYGCPRIGNDKWRRAFNESHKMYRFVNDRDIVPRIPPKWMRYKHAGELFHINKTGDKITKNPNPWNQFKAGVMNMCRNPLRITQGIQDHDMADYCKFIENWSKNH